MPFDKAFIIQFVILHKLTVVIEPNPRKFVKTTSSITTDPLDPPVIFNKFFVLFEAIVADFNFRIPSAFIDVA